MAKIIDGKLHAANVRAAVAANVAQATKKPALAVVLVGDDPASLVYINMKKNACAEVGISFSLHNLPGSATQAEVLAQIDTLNADANIHGIIVQQPLPAHLDKHVVVSRIAPMKDVDYLHPHNVGLMLTGQGKLMPCTPAGVIKLLHGEGINAAGKHAVVVGRSDIVGKPLAFMLLNENATVTICHSRTSDLAAMTRQADILIAALGRARFITADMVKPGAVVIDVGVNRLTNKKICGDVDYTPVAAIASYITPVPGGVGPMTVATLMENCFTAMKWQHA